MIPVILSGGSGSRLWPLSRKQYPKQFLKLNSNQTLFQETLGRVAQCGLKSPVVVCNENHRFIVTDQLSDAGHNAQAVFLEPFGRNTAPAIAIVALRMLAEGKGDETLLVLPADHVIQDTAVFNQALLKAKPFAESGSLVLFGVPARSPETGYGYIKAAAELTTGVSGAYSVDSFIEKPDLVNAEKFVSEGGYYWNSGIFLFKVKSYLEELKKYEPSIYEQCQLSISRSILDENCVLIDSSSFKECPENSIDYAVMEKTQHACMISLDAGWSDVGSWESLWDVQEKDENSNVLRGDAYTRNSSNCLIHSESKLVAVVGLDNVAVIETKDSVMVINKSQTQDVKNLVNDLVVRKRAEAEKHSYVHRPWGTYESIDNGPRFQVKRITVKPGASLSLQMHHHRAEHWIVVTGTALVTCDGREFLLSENESTYIPIGSTHRLVNPGKIPLELIEVQSGAYLGEDDIERFEDVYGRANSVAQDSVSVAEIVELV